MNIQIEHLEAHTAQMTVGIDSAQLDKAKRKAAQNIAKKVNIPGFRRGKAPYQVLMRYVGEAAILDDAVELLSNEVYPKALDESGLEPYGAGELVDVGFEPETVLKFRVALQPTVTLGDYRALRLPYDPPSVEDERVDEAIRTMQEENAVVEESHQPVILGDRVTVDIHSFFADEAPVKLAEGTDVIVTPENAVENETDEDLSTLVTGNLLEDAEVAETLAEFEDVITEQLVAESEELGIDLAQVERDILATIDSFDREAEHEHNDEDEDAHQHGGDEAFIHEHDAPIILDADHEPLPGFSEALVGANPGEIREFELTVPVDQEEYQDVAGRKVRFTVSVKKVEKMTLPALNDEFAARVTAEEESPLSLLEMRMRVRENLQSQSRQQYETAFTLQALDAMVEGAQTAFPEAMIADEVSRFMQRFDQDLQRQKLTLQDYMRIYRRTEQDLYTEYRPTAEKSVKRSLIMRELMVAERMTLTTDELGSEIDRIIEPYGEEQRQSLLQMFSDRAMLDNVANDILRARINARIGQIARGEAPDIPEAPAMDTGIVIEDEADAALMAANEAGESSEDAPQLVSDLIGTDVPRNEIPDAVVNEEDTEEKGA